MNQKIISTIIIFGLLTVIPTAYGQLSLGSEAKQELIEVKINPDGEINVKHVVSPSNMPTTVPLFLGEISNLIITDDLGEEINSGTANDAKGNLSVLLLPSNQNSIITYNLENMKINNNLFNTEISYPQKFSVIFEESINLIFLNNNVLFLDDKKGVSINGGGNMKIEFYSTESKIIEKATWEENEFDVEIITDSEIQSFNFNQPEKSLSFQVNDENKFVTITMSEELLGGPYVTLLDDEKIKYTKFVRDEGIVSLNLKPETTGQVTIIGTTVIPEFSMFIPLIMGFLIILTVPAMRKFSLR
ncbi:MAG: hypothetical protein HOF28_02510 [Nitrosopumilus sp.]|nr:hypothetical protein [Nitrosopumilus sp.]